MPVDIEPGPLLARVPPGAALCSVRSGAELAGPELVATVMARARELAALQLGEGARVVVAEPDPLDYVVTLLAAWQAGLVAVAVNPALASPEQQTVLATTGARAWLGVARVPLPKTPPAPGGSGPLASSAPALILMTSGTTGRPKGIVHSQASLLSRIGHNLEAIGHDSLAETLCVLPVFFGHGLIGNVLTPLLAGGRVRLWPGPDLAELRGLGPRLDALGTGFMSSVPSFWKLALRLSPRPQRPLVRVHVGSAPLAHGLWQEIADWCGTRAVYNLFGMTETANWIAGAGLDEAAGRDGHVGRAWGGRLAVRSEAGAILDAGQGEVLVRSPSLMLGYFERPDLDAEAMQEGWFRTGDTGMLSPDGSLTLVGRIKSEINRGGIKVLAEEVDMLLERHPDIAEACAFGVPDPVAGEAVAAAIVLVPGARADVEAIKSWCRGAARAEAVPSRLHVVAAIPRNDRGKVVRAEVRRLLEQAS